MSPDLSTNRAFSCREARQLLQVRHDDEQSRVRGGVNAPPAPVSPSLALHLEGCAQCRGFQRLLAGLAADLAAAYEPRGAPALPVLEGPARRSVPPRGAWRRAPVLVPALAAALAVAVGVPAGLAARERAALRTEVSAFVDGLYTTSPLEGVEVAAAGTSTGIFDGLGTEPWLDETPPSP